MKNLRRMVRLLPPGCGQARRDRGETVGRRPRTFRPLALGSPVRTVHGRHRGLRNDDERMEERICRKLKLAVSAAYLPTHTPVNIVSVGMVSRAIALYGVFFGGRLRNQAMSAAMSSVETLL